MRIRTLVASDPPSCAVSHSQTAYGCVASDIMMNNAKSAQTNTTAAAALRRGVRSRQDIVMEYVLMVLTAASVLAGVGQFLPSIHQLGFDEPVQTEAQRGFARCERPTQDKNAYLGMPL